MWFHSLHSVIVLRVDVQPQPILHFAGVDRLTSVAKMRSRCKASVGLKQTVVRSCA